MRRGLALVLAAVTLTGCHQQWGASSWGEASSSSAESNVRSAIPAVEAYYADNGTYAGMTLEGLRTTYDAGLPDVVIAAADAETYCVESTVNSESFFKAGPGADIWPGHCGDPVPTPPDPPPPAHPDAEDLVLSIIPAIEVYYAENGTYAGVGAVGEVEGISLAQVRIHARKNGTAYCVEGPRQRPSAHFVGPAGPLSQGPC
jgi:hypothetical protein